MVRVSKFGNAVGLTSVLESCSLSSVGHFNRSLITLHVAIELSGLYAILEPSDLMLTGCLSAANGWLVSRPTNALDPHCCCWCCCCYRLAGQCVISVDVNHCAFSIVDVGPELLCLCCVQAL